MGVGPGFPGRLSGMPSLFHQAFEDPTANPRDVYLARLAILAITVTILGSLMLIALLASR